MSFPSTHAPARHVFIGSRRIDQAAADAGTRLTPHAPTVAIIAPAGTPAERRRQRQRQAAARDA